MSSNTDINTIRQLFAPPGDLSTFNPGKYFNELEFSNPSFPYLDDDAEGLVQMVFFIDYLAMSGESTERENSIIYGDTSFFTTLRTNFKNLDRWPEIEEIIKAQEYMFFTDLVRFFFMYFQPKAIA